MMKTNFLFVKDKDQVRVVNNHPVHIFEESGNLSPTSFIPFCSFGGDMKILGIESKKFKVPVCNSFKAKVRNDQLCYQIDLEDYKDMTNIEKQLKEGLVLIVDKNVERQLPHNLENKDIEEKEGFFLLSDDHNSFQIHLETISIINN